MAKKTKKAKSEPAMTPDALGNQHGYKCPKCKGGDRLSIVGLQWQELSPDGAEGTGDIEWDGKSAAQCRNCGWVGCEDDLIVVEVVE